MTIDGQKLNMGIGRGTNKKIAEQEAAMNTLSEIDEEDIESLAGRDLE